MRGCPQQLVEDGELLVSELVSNAVVHAGTPIELLVSHFEGHDVLVEVRDGSSQPPVPRRYRTAASTGRGLHLLEQLASQWGVEPHHSGKTVWFRLADNTDRPSDRPASELPREWWRTDLVLVELLDLPLELYLRWQEQAEALLREFLLWQLEDDREGAALQRHAECSDAIAVLARAVVAVGTSPEPHLTHRRSMMPVPIDSVGHFRSLDATLEEAIAVAQSDRLLAAPTDPATRRLRRWLCGEVAAQAAGLPPKPWVTP